MINAAEGSKAAKGGIAKFLATATFMIDSRRGKSPVQIGEDLLT